MPTLNMYKGKLIDSNMIVASVEETESYWTVTNADYSITLQLIRNGEDVPAPKAGDAIKLSLGGFVYVTAN